MRMQGELDRLNATVTELETKHHQTQEGCSHLMAEFRRMNSIIELIKAPVKERATSSELLKLDFRWEGAVLETLNAAFVELKKYMALAIAEEKRLSKQLESAREELRTYVERSREQA